MKKYLFIALASLFAFASCSKESNETPEVKDDNIVNLTFTSKRPQLKSESKTAWNGSTIVWSEGDKIRVGYTLNGNWMGQKGAGTAKFYQSSNVSIDATNSTIGTFSVPTNFEDQGSGSYIFYGYYPDYANSASEAASAPEISLTVPTSQTPGATTFDATADVMLGKTASLSLTGLPTDPIEINWSRLVAHLDLTFKNLAFVGTETISSITLTANEDSKLTGTFTVDVTSGTMSEASSNVVVMEGAHLVPNSGNVEAWCCVLPVTITSLDVEIVTDKAKYTRSISGISKTFKQNARNTLAVNMSGATRTEQSEVYELYSGTISEGDYVIVYDGAAMKNTVSSDRLQFSDVTISDKKIANPASDIVWHIAPSGDNWTIYSAAISKYAAATGVKSQAALSEDGTDDKSLWAVSGSDTYEFVNKNNSSKGINANLRKNGTYGFACYASSTGGALSLYKLADGRADAGISFAATSFELNVGDDFTAPTLSNPNNVAVVYSSSDENLAVVDENTGEVVIGDKAGTVTITASFAGDETYKAGSASYSITIKPVGHGSVEEPMSPSDIRSIINTLEDNSTTSDYYYVEGYLDASPSYFGNGKLTFTFVDSEGNNQIKAYNCLGLNGNNFNSKTDLKEGDYVVVYGKLEKFVKNNVITYEVVQGQLAKLTTAPSSGSESVEVTFTPGIDIGETSVTKDGVTVTMTTMDNSSYYQVYANESMTVKAPTNKIIKSIAFTCTASGKSKYGPGNASADPDTYSYSGNTGSWTGSASSVTISSTVQIRMTSLTVTYE